MSTLVKSKHILALGSLDWKGRPHEDGWAMWALAEGATLGNPVPVEREMAHQLLDGSIVEVDHHDNRMATFDVLIEAPNSIALNKGAAALARECLSPSTLTFMPPDGLGVQTVFQVLAARAEWVFDDRDELRTQRRFRVTLECHPFGRSPEPTEDLAIVVEAPEGDQEINDCDAITGFTALDGATVALDTSIKQEGTGSIKVTPASFGNVWYETAQGTLQPGRYLTADAAVELTGLSLTEPEKRPFITFYGYAKDTRSFSATLRINGVPARLIRAVRTNATWVKFTFHTEVTDTITSLRIDQHLVYSGLLVWIPTGDGSWTPHPLTQPPADWAPRVDNIRRDGNWATTARQSIRSIAVGGSARTEGSLEISHPTNGLGKVLLLTCPSLSQGFTPDLMQWCTVTTDADATSISGEKKSFTSTAVPFEIPAAQVRPGSYQLIGFLHTGGLRAAGGARVLVNASTKVGSTTISSSERSQKIEDTANGVYEFVDCGPITLPTSRVPAGADATVRLTINVVDHAEYMTDGTIAAGGAFQEFYLIPLGEGTALNIFNCGSGGSAAVGTANNRLWLDAATLASSTPSAWMGTQADRSDAYHAGSAAMRWQPPSFTPPEVLVFMANSGGTYARVNLRYTKAWQGLAAD